MELLYVLLKMTEVKECAEALISGLIVQKVLVLVMRNAERTAKLEVQVLPQQPKRQDSFESSRWTKV